MVIIARRKPWPLLVVLLLMVATILWQPASPAAAKEHPAGTQVTDLGPASEVTSTSVAEQIGDHIWTATSGVSPVKVGAYNKTTHLIDRTIDLPTGVGVWGTAHIGTDLYVGTYTPGDLYRIDTTTGSLTKVANFGSFIWAITASPDGKIFAGTFPDAGVWEFDPTTGATKKYGTVAPGEQYVRGIAVSATTIYAGIGSHAQLIAIERTSGVKTNVLPAEYADRTFVATMELSGNTLAVSLSPTGTMLVFDTQDLAHPTEVQLPNRDLYITAITIDPATGDLYLGTRPSGTLYRYSEGAGLQRLGSPYDGAYFNRILLWDGKVGASLTSQIVEYEPTTGGFTGFDLTAGLPPAPELAMQITATKDKVLVSGKAGIQIHDLLAGSSRRVFLPGEAKTMTPVGNTIHLGVYTLARLFTMAPDGSAMREVARVENEQTRPTDAVYDEVSNQLLIATEADYGKINGALAIRNLGTGALSVHRGIIPNQSVRSVAVKDGIAYLGSETRNSLGTNPIVKTATVSAVDLSTGQVLWQITPVDGAQQISDVVSYHGRIYGTTDTGKLFELDPSTAEVTAIVQMGAGQSTLVSARSGLYGTDGKRLFQITNGPSTPPQVTTVLDGLTASTYGVGLIAASPDGSAIYTIRGRNLIKVTLN